MGGQSSTMEDLGMNLDFWRNKKVLLTGHTGFKGSWLSLWLQQLQAQLIGFSLAPPTEPNLFSIAQVAQGMQSVIGNICDFETLKKLQQQHEPEIIIHMAAQPLVRYSYQNPIETYATNVMGTVNVLEAARQVGSAKAILVITSDKCYDNKEWHWSYRENDRLGGHDPYSNSKACAELVVSAFGKSYGTAIASARAGNVIGGGDWAQDRLIPDLMRGVINQEEITIRYPHALRPWQHVLDPLAGYLQLAEHLYLHPDTHSGAWNFGPHDHDVQPVSWIIKKISELSTKNVLWKLEKNHQPHEASYLKLDSSKAKNQLNWQPRWGLERALQETVSWYEDFQTGKDMRDKTVSQITHFIG